MRKLSICPKIGSVTDLQYELEKPVHSSYTSIGDNNVLVAVYKILADGTFNFCPVPEIWRTIQFLIFAHRFVERSGILAMWLVVSHMECMVLVSG